MIHICVRYVTQRSGALPAAGETGKLRGSLISGWRQRSRREGVGLAPEVVAQVHAKGDCCHSREKEPPADSAAIEGKERDQHHREKLGARALAREENRRKDTFTPPARAGGGGGGGGGGECFWRHLLVRLRIAFDILGCSVLPRRRSHERER